MNATELRIGNYISSWRISDQWELKKIECGKELDFIFMQEENNIYKAIPLTEEWLMKLGFEKNAISYSIDTGKVFLKISENEPELFYAMASQVDDIVSLKDDLKFVHQLQNLFFALTGEELNFKLES